MTAPTPQTNAAMNTSIIAASHDAFAPAATPRPIASLSFPLG
jgi:hypothetical protein